MKARTLLAYASVVAGVIIAAGCNSASPSSPSALAGIQPGAGPSGATINGSVTGPSVTSSRGLATLAGPGLTVTVNGTDLSALVDASGAFLLNHVPAGDAQLRFSGPGTDATVTLTSVTSGEEIRITVNVSGNRASIENLTRPGSERRADNAEVEGVVTSGTCASFVVNRVTVTTNAATVFERGTCAGIKTGVEVEVEGTRQADGSVLARLVKFEDDDDDEEDDEDDDNGKIELEGLVTAGGCWLSQ